VDAKTQAVLQPFIERASLQLPDAEYILFGSRARADARSDSDVDLAIIIPENNAAHDAIRHSLNDIAFDVMLDYGLLISPLIISQNVWQGRTDPLNAELLRNIQKDGIPISYEQQ
jgi:predicted nucleotidyltransferase